MRQRSKPLRKSSTATFKRMPARSTSSIRRLPSSVPISGSASIIRPMSSFGTSIPTGSHPAPRMPRSSIGCVSFAGFRNRSTIATGRQRRGRSTRWACTTSTRSRWSAPASRAGSTGPRWARICSRHSVSPRWSAGRSPPRTIVPARLEPSFSATASGRPSSAAIRTSSVDSSPPNPTSTTRPSRWSAWCRASFIFQKAILHF